MDLWLSFEGMEAIWHAVPTPARHSKRSKQNPKTSGHLIIFNYIFWSLDFPKYMEFQFRSLKGGPLLISRELDSSLTIWKSDCHALASQFAWHSWTLLHETSTSLSSGLVHLPCLCLPNVTELDHLSLPSKCNRTFSLQFFWQPVPCCATRRFHGIFSRNRKKPKFWLHQFPEKLLDSAQWMPTWAGACWPLLFLFFNNWGY